MSDVYFNPEVRRRISFQVDLFPAENLGEVRDIKAVVRFRAFGFLLPSEGDGAARDKLKVQLFGQNGNDMFEKPRVDLTLGRWTHDL